MSEIAGLAAPVFVGTDVRPMTEADSAAVRACDDPDQLLALQLKLRTGAQQPGRRPVLLATGAWAIVTGLLIIARAAPAIIIVAAVVLSCLLGAALYLQSRARKRVIAAVGWLGVITFRLQQLAAKG